LTQKEREKDSELAWGLGEQGNGTKRGWRSKRGNSKAKEGT